MAEGTVFGCFSIGSVAATYDEIYVPRIFIPWARLLLERADLTPGESVLDVATGPGTVARLAAEQVGPRGQVVGTDISAAMIGIAQAKAVAGEAAAIEYLVAPAAPLPVADGSFDVVSCQQGLQFFPDRPAAWGRCIGLCDRVDCWSRPFGAESRCSRPSRPSMERSGNASVRTWPDPMERHSGGPQ